MFMKNRKGANMELYVTDKDNAFSLAQVTFYVDAEYMAPFLFVTKSSDLARGAQSYMIQLAALTSKWLSE